MCETPIWVMILSKENAIEEYRELMDRRNPQEAASGTLRRDFAETITRNAVHGFRFSRFRIPGNRFFLQRIGTDSSFLEMDS
jgi:nucleoside-diphosphate kinase